MARYFRLSDGRKVTADNDGAVRELIKWGVDNKIGVSEYFIYQDPQNKQYEVDAWARERALQHPALKGAVNVGEMGPRTAPDMNKPAQEPQKKQLQQSEPTTNVDLRNVRNTSKAVEYQHPGGGFQEFYSQVQSGKVTAPQVKNIDPAKYTEEQLNKNITEPRLREAYQSWQNRRTETPYQPNSQTRLDKAVSERERIGRDIENLVLARPPDSETELLKNWKISYEGEVDKYNFYTEQIIPYRATGLNAAQRELADSAAKWADKYPALAATVGQLGMGLWGLATSPYNLITAGMGRDNEAYYALRQGISQGLAGKGLWNDVGSGFYSFGLVAPLAIGTALSGGTASPLLAKALGVAGTATMQMSITSDIMRELYQDDNYLSFMEAGAAAVSGAAQQLTENLSLSFQTKALSNAFKLGGQAGLRQATSELVRKAFAPTLGEQAVGLLQTFGTEILEENLQWAEDAVIQNVMLGKPMPTWEETKQAVRDNTIGALFGVVLQSGAMMGVQARQSRTSAQALKALAADESGWTSPKLAQQAIDQLTAGQIGEAAETAQKAHQALISSDAAMDEKAKRHVLKAVGSVYGAANMYDAQTAANVFIEEKAAKKELAALEQEKRKLEKAIPSQQTEDKLFLLNEKIEEADAELVRLQGVITENAQQKAIYDILNEASKTEQKARKAGDKALDKLTDSKAYKEATQEEQDQMREDVLRSNEKANKLADKAKEKYRDANLYKLRQTPAYKQAAPEVQTQMEEAELQRQQEAIAAEFEAARQKAISEQQEAEKAAETASNEATEEIEVIPDIIDQLEAKKAALRQERQDINKELNEYRKLMDQQGGWLPSVTPEQKKAYHEVKQRQKEVNRKLNEVGIEIRKEKAAQKKAAAEQQKPKKKAKPKEKKKTEKPQETEAKEQPKKSKKAEAKETKKKEKPETKKEAPQKEKEAEPEPEKTPKKEAEPKNQTVKVYRTSDGTKRVTSKNDGGSVAGSLDLNDIKQQMLAIKSDPALRDQYSGQWRDSRAQAQFSELRRQRDELLAKTSGQPSPAAIQAEQQRAWDERVESAKSLAPFARLTATQLNVSEWSVYSGPHRYTVQSHHKAANGWKCTCSVYRHEGRCRHADYLRYLHGADLDLSVYDAPRKRPDWVRPGNAVDVETAEIREQLNDIARENRLPNGKYKSEALQETLPTIPDKTADDALLGMVKSHILSITRKDRTTTVNFKDGRQLVINHITQEAMLTEAGKTGVMYAGRTQGEKGKNVYTAIVDLVDGLNQGNRTLFHEAFHVVWKLFLNSEQISYINQYYRAKANKGELVRKYVVTRQGTEMAIYWTKEQFNALNKERQAEELEEGAAYGFEHWLGSRTDTAPTTMIGKLWQRLADAIRHALVKLNLANQNAKLTDIFHAVASDKLTGQGEQGAETRNMLSNVYHGSGAFFDRFDVQYVGTGEGAQAFGWGIYVTEKYGVAHDYAKRLERTAGTSIKWRGMGYETKTAPYSRDLSELIKDLYSESSKLRKLGSGVSQYGKPIQYLSEGIDAGLEMQDAINNAMERIISGINAQATDERKKATIEYAQYLLNTIKRKTNSGEMQFVTNKGGKNLYTVDVWGDRQEDVLEWEGKVTEEQSDKIMAQAKKEGIDALSNFPLAGLDGRAAYKNEVARLLGSQKAASEFLLRAGIDGIKYPVNATSGGKGEKGYNYVVFDADQIQIKDHTRYKPVPTADVAENKTTKSPYRAYLTPFRGDITKPKILSRLKNNNAPKGRIKLFEEIRKFDSAEELSDHIFYHGTTNYIDKGLKPSIAFSDRFVEQSGGGGYGQKYWAISLSKSKNIASDFSGTQSAVTVYPVILRKGANVISMPDIQDAADLDDIIVNLWKNEIDAVYIGDPNGGEQELAVLNPKAIYTFDNPDTYAVFGKQRLNNLTPERIAEIYQIAQDRKGAVDRIRELPKEERQGAIRELTRDIRFKPVPTASEVAEGEQWAETRNKVTDAERIVGAHAIINGKHYTGTTHGDTLNQAMKDGEVVIKKDGYYYDKDGSPLWGDGWNDYFITNTGRVLDRFDALSEFGIAGAEDMDEQATRYKPVPTAAEVAEAERQYAEVEAKYKGTAGWLKAPNGKPTNLTERQWLQVRTPAFKDWFGDWENDPKNASKVVDENGEPMVLYNGRKTLTTKYPVKTKGYVSNNFLGSWEVERNGAFFTDNKEYARQYGEHINPVFLNIRWLGEHSEQQQNDFTETLSPFEERDLWLSAKNINQAWKLLDGEIGDRFVSYLKNDAMYDGYVFQEDIVLDDFSNLESNTYVVFSPTQIKSATANVGTFSENPDIRYRKLTERERAMRDDVWNEIMGRPPTLRAQTRPKVQTEPPEKEPERKSEPQRPQPARPSQSKPPTEAEIDVLSERIGKDLGIAPAQVKEKLGRQMMAAWREAQGDISRLMESAAIRNFEEWVENNKPEGTDSRDLTWHWEEMLEYAAKVGLSREQIAQMVKSDRFDATAIGINLFQRMNYVGKLLVETEATLADRNWGTPAEREQKEAQYGILQAQFDELQAAYAMQGSEAGTVLWTRRQNKAQYLENLTRAAQALESKINRGSLELAEKRQELDGLERTISDLEKSFEMLLRVMDGKRYKDITEMSNAELEAERQKQAERLNDLRNRAERLRYEIDQKVAAMQADKGRQEETQTQIRKIRKTGRKAKVIEIKERKPDVHDWIRAAWYNSVLAGIPTHMVNMSANVVNSLLEDVITLFAQGGKVAGAQFAEKVRALFSNYEQLDPKTGEKIKTGAFAKAKEEFTNPQEFSKKNEVILKGNKLFMGIQFSTKFLGAEDMLAFFPNERGMLKSLAFDESKRTGRSVADLMENPTSDMLRQAYYEARRNTFNQNPEGYVGVLIEAINKFYNALDQSGGGGKAIGNLIRFNVMPFTRVLGNVLNATIDYTPLGMIRYFAYKSDNPNSLLNRQRKDQNGRPLWLDENGDRMVSPFKARDARRQAARVALGTILGSLLYFLTMSADDDDEDKWFISGAGPQDYKKYKQLMAAGWRPYSIHIGNTIISYKEWPVSGAFAVVGNLHDIQKYDGKTRPQDWMDKTIYATMGVASSFLDRSFASNAISTATALDRGDPKWVKRSLTSTTSSTIIPYNNMLRFIENTYNRDLYTPETIAQQAWASVPLVPKKGLPRRVNVFGMYEKKDPATARLAMTDNVGLVVPDTKKTREIFQTVRKNNLFLSETTKREHRVDPYVGKRGIPEEDKQYIWLQGKDHENFRVMRGTEYVRLLNEPQNYNLIMQYDKNKDKDELAALLTSLGRKATAYATEETLKAYQRGELKHKYNTYNKSREEED